MSAQRQPIFNAPTVVVVVLGVLVAVHALRQVIDDETALWWTVALAFVPARFFSAFTDIPGGNLASVTSFLTHALVHGDAVHLAINSAWLLAFGSAVARRVGSVRFLALFAASAIAGAALYLAFNTDSKSLAIMVGASGAISGLVGGAFRFFFRALEADDPEGLSGASNWVPTMSLSELAGDQQARVAVIAWLVLNLVFAVLGPVFGWASSIAWEAHLGGFLMGLLAFPLFDRIGNRPDAAAAD